MVCVCFCSACSWVRLFIFSSVYILAFVSWGSACSDPLPLFPVGLLVLCKNFCRLDIFLLYLVCVKNSRLYHTKLLIFNHFWPPTAKWEFYMVQPNIVFLPDYHLSFNFVDCVSLYRTSWFLCSQICPFDRCLSSSCCLPGDREAKMTEVGPAL